MPDPLGLVAALGFIAAGLLLIPLNDYLDRRRASRRLAERRLRDQAHKE